MSTDDRQETPSRITVAMADVVVALLFVAVGALVSVDSYRIGAGWAEDGPQAGYFPFYVGLMLIASGLITAVLSLRRDAKWHRIFATREELRRVFDVLLPTAIYVVAIFLLGIYLSSALFIGWFMVRHGGFRAPITLAVAIGVPLLFFLLFERWFLVPLPKGPIEQMLGL
jgi:putative tricarboxylic transport membrane protein